MAGLADLLPDNSVLTRVGERSREDPNFEPDEFALIDRGIVAPRPKGVPANAENAAAAVIMQAQGGVPSTSEGFQERARGIRELLGIGDKPKKLKKAQAGITNPDVFAGSGLLQGLLASLGNQAQTFAVDVPAVQQSLMAQVGSIRPDLLGITDPQEFRIRFMLGLISPEQEAALRSVVRGRDPSQHGQPSQTTGALIFDPAISGRAPETRQRAEQFLSNLGLEIPTLGAQQFGLQQQQIRTQRELRGLQPTAGANAIPSFG
jgi:hypothetical protein